MVTKVWRCAYLVEFKAFHSLLVDVENLVSLRTYAKSIHRAPETVYYWVRKGYLFAYRIDGIYYVSKDAEPIKPLMRSKKKAKNEPSK